MNDLQDYISIDAELASFFSAMRIEVNDARKEDEVDERVYHAMQDWTEELVFAQLAEENYHCGDDEGCCPAFAATADDDYRSDDSEGYGPVRSICPLD